MRKYSIFILVLCLLFLYPAAVFAGQNSCATIQSGALKYSPGHFLAGQPLTVGFDPYGYNYQGHMFKGYYINAYLGKDGLPPYDGDDKAYLSANPNVKNKWYWPYRDVKLEMKWNDSWLSNKDCNNDGKLDRPDDNGDSYIGSGAWITNHMSGGKGNSHWVYFTKIIAVPADAKKVKEGSIYIWYTAEGVKIGPEIWGSFAIVQEVESGSGVLYVSPVGAGLGRW